MISSYPTPQILDKEYKDIDPQRLTPCLFGCGFAEMDLIFVPTLLGHSLTTLNGLQDTRFALACFMLTTRTTKLVTQKLRHIGSRKS